MTPEETLAFFLQGISRASKGLEIAASTGNSELIALNVRQLFKCHLVRGLIQWRAGQSPVVELSAALTVVGENVSACPDLRDRLPVARAFLLAALLDEPSPSSDTAPSASAEESLDLALAWRASGASGTAQLGVNEALMELERTKRTSLAAKSYRNYFDIVSRRGTEPELGELVSRGEALYLRRASDPYFAGAEQSEGGGLDNPLVLDYRLALALKIVGYRGPSRSAWLWGASA